MNDHPDHFDYALPEELIAQRPVEPRSAARLLVDRGSSAPGDLTVSQLPELLQSGDLLVVNDTKVLPARLRLHRRTGGAIEVLLLDRLDDECWECLVRPARRLRAIEELLDNTDTPILRVEGRIGEGDAMTFRVRSLVEESVLFAVGEMPLPPYIHEQPTDPGRYQTVYARRPASAAAPTAGLHFTAELLDTIRSMGVAIANVELVVGLDTFRPLSGTSLSEHRMHTESYHVPESTQAACRDAGRVIAVGTTAARALESAALFGASSGRTNLFIRPGHEWRVVDLLLTNFHMPRTTLLVMIEALIGPRWRHLYSTAIDRKYRFLSFGDAMLLDRHAPSIR